MWSLWVHTAQPDSFQADSKARTKSFTKKSEALGYEEVNQNSLLHVLHRLPELTSVKV